MPSPFAYHWRLDPAVTFLNHGSFGATPRAVLDAQQVWRDRIETEPVHFYAHDMEPALEAARTELAGFLGADPADMAFVPNATSGFNAVLRSLDLAAGDELLTTDHEYNAARNALEYVAARAGARVAVASLPFPGTTPELVVDAILRTVTPRTRLALLDHVTSATALVLPIDRLVPLLAERGVPTLVDGAHGPGMVDLQLDRLGAAYYTGNLHKWVCAPKGAAFLWVSRENQARVRPLAISHGMNSPRRDRSRFLLEFDWTGTADPSAYLTVPDALRFGAGLLPGGWPALRARNHDLALAGRDLLCSALGSEPPVADEMVGSMASVPLPVVSEPAAVQGVDLYADPVHAALMAQGIQVMVTPWPQRPDGGPWRRLVRVSAAAYNDRADMERLAAVLPGIAARTHPPAGTGA